MGEFFDEVYMENPEEYEIYFKKHNILSCQNDIKSQNFLSENIEENQIWQNKIKKPRFIRIFIERNMWILGKIWDIMCLSLS